MCGEHEVKTDMQAADQFRKLEQDNCKAHLTNRSQCTTWDSMQWGASDRETNWRTTSSARARRSRD